MSARGDFGTARRAPSGGGLASGAARGVVLVVVFLAPFVCVFLALFAGRYAVSVPDVLGALAAALAQLVENVLSALSLQPPDMVVAPTPESLVVQEIRLPRVIAAALVGAALSLSGAAYQGVFRNPLVNPGLLGVSSGAGFGAALAIVAGGGALIYPSAFAFGVFAVALSYWIARVYRQAPAIMLILGGTIVSAVFSALVSLMKYVADPETELPEIVYWLMGSLASVSWEQLWAFVPLAIGAALLLLSAWRIDVLSMGDKEARSLGLDVRRDKVIVVLGATLATAAAVCVAGEVGWVGLVIPHIGRMIVGSGNRVLMPVSMALGAAFMVVVDTAARCLWPSEIPLGILTALIGAPFFVYLLKKTKGGTWR